MKRPAKKYYFSVEGETEKWYFEWLKNTINSSIQSKYNISLDCKIQKDPFKYAKGLRVLGITNITHIFDRESEEPVHTEQFTATLGRMKEAEESGKTIKYHLGYSNFSFELWMVLHKIDCNGAKAHRSHYLNSINLAYNEKFENLDKYKKEHNFKRVLGKLTLDDVKQAVRRSKGIMQENAENGHQLYQEYGYSYYKKNPSLSIWLCVEKILKDCRLLEV